MPGGGIDVSFVAQTAFGLFTRQYVLPQTCWPALGALTLCCAIHPERVERHRQRRTAVLTSP
jgi:hypothetical protein